jgi:gas vesicle GvpC-like protein
VSLHDSWQVSRKQRQQEVLDRQQHVRLVLSGFQQERQEKMVQLREELRLFQLGLQLDTQDFLAATTAQRQIQAAEVSRQLQTFVQTLRAQTTELISLSAADRSIMAEQLAQDLGEFHGNLTTSVVVLRQTLQQQMQEIRCGVHALLHTNQQERMQQHLQRMRSLDEWLNTLRSSVQTYLSEMELLRQERRQQVGLMLEVAHVERTTAMNSLFQELSQFRGELAEYCTELRRSVWGDSTVTPGKSSPASIPLASISLASMPKPSEKPIAPPSPKTVAKKAASRAKRKPFQSSAPTVSSAAKPQQTPAATAFASQSELKTELNHDTKAERNETQIEKDIYTSIYQSKGARLTELETALGINRFQAVDALRSLIKKGLVTQRDRLYLIQEDMKL